MLICGEWTYVDTKMKLLVESVWKCCFQVSTRFHCWTTAVRIELNFRFLVLYRRSSHMYKLTSFLGLEYIWDTDRYCLWSMAKFASFWLQRISCFCCLCWSRIMSPHYQWNIYINYLNTHYRMHPWGCNVPGRFIIICRSRLLQNATRLHQIHYK